MDNVQGAVSAVKDFNSDFRAFSTNTQLITFAAAVCIGLATKDVIQRLLDDVILPLLTVIVNHSLIHVGYDFVLNRLGSNTVASNILKTLGSSFWIILVYLIIVIVTFVILNKFLKIDFFGRNIGYVEKAVHYGTTYRNTKDNVKKEE